MHVHIIEDQKFTQKLVELIDDHYPEKSNYIYIYGDRTHTNRINSENVKYIKSFREIKLPSISSNDKLVIHGFYDHQLLRYLATRLFMINKNNMVLVVWGADLYDVHYKVCDGMASLSDRFHECLKKRIVKHARLFMTFAYGDYKLLTRWYGAQGIQFDCIYPTNADTGYLDSLNKEKRVSDEYSILIGNSATKTNQHREVLMKLERFKDYAIRILCPLSYGDVDYAKNIEEFGISIFGEKFIPIKEYMDINSYCDLLASCDIAVFNNNRQQGTGNMEILGYLGKKIYIRSDTTTWDHYVERDKCKFYDTLGLTSITYEEFVSFDEESRQKNRRYFGNIWDIGYIKSLWDKVLDFRTN